MTAQVFRIRDYHGRSRDDEPLPNESAVVVIMPTVRIERVTLTPRRSKVSPTIQKGADILRELMIKRLRAELKGKPR